MYCLLRPAQLYHTPLWHHPSILACVVALQPCRFASERERERVPSKRLFVRVRINGKCPCIVLQLVRIRSPVGQARVTVEDNEDIKSLCDKVPCPSTLSLLCWRHARLVLRSAEQPLPLDTHEHQDREAFRHTTPNPAQCLHAAGYSLLDSGYLAYSMACSS